ncbi:hypothetical protein, partial [Klebsiella pneumoniae]|uniref:hypothetical protein n=1 Tax=Klebsiella pneumoniae TaxID=573 RepID=UPI001C52C1C8
KEPLYIRVVISTRIVHGKKYTMKIGGYHYSKRTSHDTVHIRKQKKKHLKYKKLISITSSESASIASKSKNHYS